MKSFGIFLTELRRSLQLNLTLFFCLFLLGFALCAMLKIERQIESWISPINWDADLVILPKGVSLDGLHRSLLTGSAEGLIPLALFDTLQGQTASSPLKILGVIPYLENSQIKIGHVGQATLFPFHSDGIWSSLPLSAREDRPEYQTPEWGGKVISAILVRGPQVSLESLKTLIDRRTIAQAWYVTSELSQDVLRAAKMQKGLEALTLLLVICLIPGIALSFLILRERLRSISVVLKEVGIPMRTRRSLVFMQTLAFVILPLALGILFAAMLLQKVWLT